jgi:hypothetical protein
MKAFVTMSSRRFGAYEAKSYFVDVSKDAARKVVRLIFINDHNRVETCEVTIEADVLTNIATAIQSAACTSYHLNVVGGRIANQDKLTTNQRIARLEGEFADILLGERVPLDVWDKHSGEVLYRAGTKITKNVIREMALHFNALETDSSPFRKRIHAAVRRCMN